MRLSMASNFASFMASDLESAAASPVPLRSAMVKASPSRRIDHLTAFPESAATLAHAPVRGRRKPKVRWKTLTQLAWQGQREFFTEAAVALQVPLAAHRRALVVKLLRVQQHPGPSARRARAGAGVVLPETAAHIVGPADIGQMAGFGAAAEDVNEAGHAAGISGTLTSAGRMCRRVRPAGPRREDCCCSAPPPSPNRRCAFRRWLSPGSRASRPERRVALALAVVPRQQRPALPPAAALAPRLRSWAPAAVLPAGEKTSAPSMRYGPRLAEGWRRLHRCRATRPVRFRPPAQPAWRLPGCRQKGCRAARQLWWAVRPAHRLPSAAARPAAI